MDEVLTDNMEYHPYYDEDVRAVRFGLLRQAIYVPSMGHWELTVPYGAASWRDNPFHLPRSLDHVQFGITEEEALQFVRTGAAPESYLPFIQERPNGG